MTVNHSSIITLPGRRGFKLRTVDVNSPLHETGMSKSSPEWMVSIKSSEDILHSYVSGYEVFSELYGWSCELSRETVGDAGNAMYTTSSVRHSDLVIMIPMRFYAPKLEQYMYDGTLINEINIVRLSWVNPEGKKITEIQRRIFKICRILRFCQQLSRLVLHFNVTEYSNGIKSFNRNGTEAGNSMSSYEIQHNKWGTGSY